MASINRKCAEWLNDWAKSARELLYNPSANQIDADTAILNSAKQALVNPTIRQRIGSYVRNSYLSALATHTWNAISQSGQLLLAPVLRAGGGKPGEAVAMLKGMMTGAAEAFPRFMAGLTAHAEDFDGNTHRAFNMVKNKKADYILNFPTQLTGALDKGFSAVLERMEFNAMLYRIRNKFPDEYFTSRGIDKDNFIRELEQVALKNKDGNAGFLKLLEVSAPDLHRQLQDFAAFNVFRTPLGNSLLDNAGKALSRLKELEPVTGNLVLPFIRTAINIAKEGAGYVPGGGMARIFQTKSDIKQLNNQISKLRDRASAFEEKASKALFDTEKEKFLNRADVFKKKAKELEGAVRFKEEKIPEFYAQQLVGAGLMMYTVQKINDGEITGHYSSDANVRERQIASGMKETSIKLNIPGMGPMWVNYGRFEPLSTVLGLTVDAANAIKQNKADGKPISENLGSNVAHVVAANFLNKTFTESLGKMFLALQEPGRYGEAFIVSLTNPVVPNIVNAFAKYQDRMQKEVRDPNMLRWIENNFKQRIPTLREQLPNKVNALGQPQEQDLMSIITGLSVTSVDRAKVNTLFDNPYLKISPMDRKVEGVELSNEEYAAMTQQAGYYVDLVANNLANNPAFSKLPRPLQADMFKDLINDMRGLARFKTIASKYSDPEVRAGVLYRELQKEGLTPDTIMSEYIR